MRYIAVVKLNAGKSNLIIDDCIIKPWRIKWENNEVIGLISIPSFYVKNNQVFEYLRDKKTLGYLIDILTFCTGIPISCKEEYFLYQIYSNHRINLFDENFTISYILNEIKKNKLKENGKTINEWPIIIDNSLNKLFQEKQIILIKILLNKFSNILIKSNTLKLINYWRKGLELETLWYWDESYLVFFKILEYFEKNYKKNLNADMERAINNCKDKNEKKALKILLSGGISKIEEDKVAIIKDFILIRNNFDIAHMRIKPLLKDRLTRLHFSYYYQYWYLHDYIKEITRLFILKNLGFRDFCLKSEGGLLKLDYEF